VRLALDLPDERASLNADEAGIEQVLANLVSNAISAAGLGGTVRLSVQLREHEVEIGVVDDGPASRRTLSRTCSSRSSPPSRPARAPVWDWRWRAVSCRATPARSPPRTSRRRAAARASSCGLPRAKDPTPTAMAREAAARQARKPSERALRILMVDDEEPVRAVVRVAAQRRGWQMVEAGDGEQALQILGEDRRFDAILCDLKMPRMTGIELHDRLARDEPQILRRVVFLTGDTASPKAVDFGARTRSRIVLKPFDVAKLLDLLRSVAAEVDGAEAPGGSTPLARPTAAG
jgi:two-component system NtrC family sensor kinase